MIYFLIIYFSLLTFVILIFDIYVVSALISSKWGMFPPFVPTTGKRKKFILSSVGDILQKTEKKLTIIDTGSGIGSLLIPLAKKFPQHQFIGIEWSKILYQYSCYKARNLSNAKFICQDMFLYSLQKADVIVCFLVPKIAKRFSEKLNKEVKDTCIIYSNGVFLDRLYLVEESPKYYPSFGNPVFVFRKKISYKKSPQ